jgi:hypothetical protein
VLTRLKAEPQRFPKLDIIYESKTPVKDPVILDLPANGIRLRFDGPQQRLRLIEVLDFTKSKLTYKDVEVFRPATVTATTPAEHRSGPTFRHIYKTLIGPTFPGEYIEPEAGDETGMGTYVLSYPGWAFSFPMHISTWSQGKDAVSLLSSSSGPPATSMGIYWGESWPDARENLYTQTLRPLKDSKQFSKNKDPVPEEVSLVRIHGEGALELVRPSSTPLWIQLGETTPQQLVAELGPPDAIYRKNDQRMSIHKNQASSSSQSRPDPNDFRQDDSTDTDQSSAHTGTDESEEEEDNDEEAAGNLSGECFYNYFYRGFDVLISKPTPPSQRPPSKEEITGDANDTVPADASSRLVASKFVLHGNVPGSYPFNRHRRCRWEIEYLNEGGDIINSESPFKDIEQRLHDEWKSIYSNAEEAKSRHRGMVLNRDWGDSPGSSVELLGGWEDSGGKRNNAGDSIKGLGNTTLFGFPGLVFEVLKNGTVSGVTVF